MWSETENIMAFIQMVFGQCNIEFQMSILKMVLLEILLYWMNKESIYECISMSNMSSTMYWIFLLKKRPYNQSVAVENYLALKSGKHN